MSFDDIRHLDDPKAMRALAHPVRLQIRELLDEEGPMTATQVAERIGESPANCSFHLRTLAKYGFIEEAEGGKGRNRPWRTVKGGLYIDADKLTGNARRAAEAVVDAIRTTSLRRIQRWVRERAGHPEAWRSAGFEMEFTTPMTPAELEEVGRRIGEILAPFQGQRELPSDARQVTLAVWGFPSGGDIGED